MQMSIFFKALAIVAFVLAMMVVGQAPTGFCTTIKDKSVCLKNSTCAWCTSAAVPSGCYESADTNRLPPGVFDCTNGTIF